MSNYTKITDFAAKDALLHGNPSKVVTGTGLGAEFDAIATAVATKVDVNGALGTPSSGVATNLTGTAAGLTAGNAITAASCSGNAATATNATNVTTNANLTGHVTSVGNAAVLGSFTKAQLNTAVSDADLASSGANSDITSMTALTTINRTGGTSIKGTNTNNNAAAGDVGEYIESTIAVGSAVSLTTGVVTNITSISLTAGDWDVSGVIIMDSGATTNVTRVSAGTSSTSATADITKGYYSHIHSGYVPGGGQFRAMPLNTSRFSLSGTTTIYLVALANFTVSTCTAYGTISARRVR